MFNPFKKKELTSKPKKYTNTTDEVRVVSQINPRTGDTIYIIEVRLAYHDEWDNIIYRHARWVDEFILDGIVYSRSYTALTPALNDKELYQKYLKDDSDGKFTNKTIVG
jgi:hypothetical protein